MNSIVIKEEFNAESLAWHYREIFWSGAKDRLENAMEDTTLDEAIEIFETIIEYATCGDYETPIDLTKLNDIIWFDWDNIFNNNEED